MTSPALIDRGLPKWPQMYTTGLPVTVEQAKEIIRRTDSFFIYGGGGNDRDWNERTAKRLCMPDRFVEYALCQAWRDRWGVIETEYVHNSWMSCAFVYGPHGWCHPSGAIGFVDNVGKWPSVKEIHSDWQAIAEAFPFLDIGVTLMSGEQCESDETRKVVSIRVRSGTAILVDPESEDVHAGHPAPVVDRGDAVMIARVMGSRSGEHGIPEEWISEWEAKAAELFGKDAR